MTSTRKIHAVWCLDGLFLFGALVLALTGAGCTVNSEAQVTDPLFEDEIEPAGPPFFEDVTKTSGINWSYRNGEELDHGAILAHGGGGVGLLDFDGAGLYALFVAGGGFFDQHDQALPPRPKIAPLEAAQAFARRPQKERHCQILGHPCKLYRNLGHGRFQDVTDQV